VHLCYPLYIRMQLHPKWEGVWEIRGNSRWNGERMVITLSSDECLLTDSRSFDEYQLTSGPESNLSAHWDFRPSGKAKRYYIGALLRERDYDEIEWTELCKKRRTDKWIRIRGVDPPQYLEQCRSRKPSKNSKLNQHSSKASNSQQQPRTIIRRKRNPNDENFHSSSNKPKSKYVPKMKMVQQQPQHNQQQNQFMDPAIMNMGHAQPQRKSPKPNQNQPVRQKKYQTRHRHPRGQFDVQYYPKPRRTTFRHQRADGRDVNYQIKDHRMHRNDPRAPPPQQQRNNQRGTRQRPERQQKRRNKNRFSRHLPPAEVDRLLADTKDFANPIVYIGEVSLSRYNPNVAYVSVDGLNRDIRVSGFVDRNRAFHGDVVAVTIYPKVEWMQVIKQDILDLKDVLDERDRIRLLEEALEDAALDETDVAEELADEEIVVPLAALEVEVEDADEYAMLPDRVVEVLSGRSDRESNNSPDHEADDETKTVPEITPPPAPLGSAPEHSAASEEIIYFADSDSDKDAADSAKDSAKNDNGKAEATSTSTDPEPEAEPETAEDVPAEEVPAVVAAVLAAAPKSAEDEKDDEKTSSKDKDEEKEKEEKEKKSQEALFSKKRSKDKMEALKDPSSITALEHFIFLKETAADFAKFADKWPSLELTDANHPRREYISSVLKKLDNARPSDLLKDFAWSSPAAHPNLMPRGKVVSIYRAKRETKTAVPGFIVPATRGPRGEIDRKWAVFTPSDRRFPRAQFPMRELPSSLKPLFRAFEREEMEIVEEHDNMQYELRRQGKDHSDAEAMCKKRRNKFLAELKLMTFEADFEHKWPDHCFMPVCHLRRELGKRGAVETETRHILSSHSISWDHTFDPKVEQHVKDMAITEADFVGRRDCRDLRVFSIDPTSARDFDDALSIEPTADGHYRIGIHIADVTHFVAPGSPVDLEARRRATSVYLVDRCLPMLPHHLCQNLCSLNPDVDRLAYSVFVILDARGKVVNGAESPWFGKTVIKSRARLNYETAHWMLEGKVTGDTPLNELDECCMISDDTTLAEIVSDTRLFWSIAKERRADRFKAGSVQFFRPHLRFRLDPSDSSKALVFGPEILLWSNNLIEEMMLLANQLVAHQLVMKARTRCVLRRHPAPLADKAMKLKLICRSQDLELDLSSPGALNASLEAMSGVNYGGISAAKAINALLAPTMQRAQYIIVADSEESEWTHWALNFPLYTHFTSPIRRYADVMVHRLLTATLMTDAEERERAMDVMSVRAMQAQCSVCNDRNAAAHFAEMDSQKVHLCLVLMEKPIVVDVLVIDIYRGRFVVVIPGLGLDQRVVIRDVIEESKGALLSVRKENELPDSVLVVKWRSGEVEEYRLFDKMRLRLSSRLKIPIQPVVEIIEPSKRRYTRAANAEAVLMEEQEEVEVEVEDGDEEEVEVPEECKSPVAMTLDSQLKVGKSDFYNAHYD